MKRTPIHFYLLSSLALCACTGDSDHNKANIDLSIGQNTQAIQTESFPLSLYVDEGESSSDLSQITSIQADFPLLHVLQQDVSYGVIDAGEQSLPYEAMAVPSNLIEANDFFTYNNNYFGVFGDDELVTFEEPNSLSNNAEALGSTWDFGDDRRLTEVTINEDGQWGWVYDREHNALINFSLNFPYTRYEYRLNDHANIQGLSSSTSALYLLETDLADKPLIYHFDMIDNTVIFNQSWKIEGLEQSVPNDLTILPDGRFVISTDSTARNLIVLEDPEARQGDGPIEPELALEVNNTFQLPSAVNQPSGLSKEQSGNWFVVTDQAEVFELSDDFSLISEQKLVFPDQACNQGCTEAIVAAQDGIYVLTDFGKVVFFQQDANGFVATQEFLIDFRDDNNQQLSFAGLGYDNDNAQFYMVGSSNNDDQTDYLLELDRDFNILNRNVITYPEDTQATIETFDAAGVTFYQNALFVVSEQYTQVLELDLQGRILRALDIDPNDIEIPSDLAVTASGIFVTGDHEVDEATPPVVEFLLPQ